MARTSAWSTGSAGVTGWYDTSGFGAGGFGEGGYRITLDFPTKAAPVPAATPCVPPAPADEPALTADRFGSGLLDRLSGFRQLLAMTAGPP